MIAALLGLAFALQAPPAPAPPATPDWRVEELVVSAKRGPVFWRAALPQGGVVWILGVPEVFATGERWDRKRLERLLDGAAELLTAPIYTLKGGRRPPGAARLGPVEGRLAPELAARFANVVREAGTSARRYDDLTLADAAHRLRADLYRVHGVAHLVDDEVPGLAFRRLLPTPPLAAFDVGAGATEAAEPDGARCIEGALADAVFAREHAAAATRAWAVGDLPTVRANTARPRVAACLGGVPAFADLQARVVDQSVASLERALDRGGHSVAVLTLGALLNPRGILARLRADGVDVTAPDSAAAVR